MTGTVEFPVGILPLHNTAPMGTGGREGDNLPFVWIAIISVVANDIANNSIRSEVHSAVAKRRNAYDLMPGIAWESIRIL